MKIGLVLQGGGTRGIYTSGILNELYKEGIFFDCIYGVSAGALNAMNYIAGQPERNKQSLNFLFSNKKFANPGNLITKHTLINLDFYFKEVPTFLPFNEKAFFESKTDLCVTATSIIDGTVSYFYKTKENNDTFFDCIKASASLPPFAKSVKIHNIQYVDGGDSDPLPFKKAMEDGCDKIIVVLTRPITYRKKQYRNNAVNFLQRVVYLNKKKYRNYSLKESWKVYNKIFDDLEKCKNKLFIIAPSEPITLGAIEKNPKMYEYFYNLGINDYTKIRKKLLNYLK